MINANDLRLDYLFRTVHAHTLCACLCFGLAGQTEVRLKWQHYVFTLATAACLNVYVIHPCATASLAAVPGDP